MAKASNEGGRRAKRTTAQRPSAVSAPVSAPVQAVVRSPVRQRSAAAKPAAGGVRILPADPPPHAATGPSGGTASIVTTAQLLEKRPIAATEASETTKSVPPSVNISGGMPGSMDFFNSADTPLPLRATARVSAGSGAGNLEVHETAGAADRADATVTRAIPPGERDEMLRRLDSIEAALRRVTPFAEQVEAERARAGIGHNQPPEPIEGPPLTETVTAGINAVNVFRTELSIEAPRIDVMRLCGTVLKWAAGAIGAALRAFGKGFFTAAGALAAHKAWPVLQPLVDEVIVQVHRWSQ
jgi:hypothetical protein